MQAPILNEQCNDTYPTNEEILNYVYGQDSSCNDLGQINRNMEFKELSVIEEGLCISTNCSINTEETLNSTGNHESKSVLPLDKEDFNDNNMFPQQDNHNVTMFFEKDSSQSPQAITNTNNNRDHTLASENKLYVTLSNDTKSVPDKTCVKHGTSSCHCYPLQNKKNDTPGFPHHCDSIIPRVEEQAKHDSLVQQDYCFPQHTNANRPMTLTHSTDSTTVMEMVNPDQLSLDSSDKLTEDTLTSSVSSYSINNSLIEGDYIEHRTPTLIDGVDNVIHISVQPQNFYQNNMIHFDGKICPKTTAKEGEYVDHDIAVQQYKHS